jgi:hypothetical protein
MSTLCRSSRQSGLRSPYAGRIVGLDHRAADDDRADVRGLCPAHPTRDRYDGLVWFPRQAHKASSRSRVSAMLSTQTRPLSIPARSSSGAREQS